MLFLSALTLIGYVAASVLPVGSAMQKRGTGTCSGSDFVTPVSVGGTSGAAFCETNWGSSYVPITAVTVFSNGNIVTGLQVTYSDKTSSAVLGDQGTTSKTSTVDYGVGDLWKRVTLFGNPGTGYVLHLLLNTTAGDLTNSGQPASNNNPNFVPNHQDVGSGILYGVKGTYNAANKIQSLSFLFLDSAISTIAISNVQFPDGPIGTNQGINPSDIGSAEFPNNTPDTITYTFGNQITETQAFAYQQTYTSTFTAQQAIQFNFGFNLLIVTGGSETSTFIWTTTNTYQTTATFTQAIQVSYNAQVPVQPGQTIDCVAIMGQGAGRFAYTSTVTITLDNGNQYTFPEDGVLTVSSFSQGEVSCSPAAA